MAYDPELHAMSLVFEALKNLDNGQRRRILGWVKDRLEATAAPTVEGEAAAMTTAPQALIPPAPAAPKPPAKKDLANFETALDLFSESSAKKSTSKVLLMAAYLQERHNYKEISSYDINFRLKRIGHGVTNISSLINGILKRKPHLLIQVDAENLPKQARRKFRVTVEGLTVARSFLNN
jgi:hypothetical protein